MPHFRHVQHLNQISFWRAVFDSEVLVIPASAPHPQLHQLCFEFGHSGAKLLWRWMDGWMDGYYTTVLVINIYVISKERLTHTLTLSPIFEMILQLSEPSFLGLAINTVRSMWDRTITLFEPLAISRIWELHAEYLPRINVDYRYQYMDVFRETTTRHFQLFRTLRWGFHSYVSGGNIILLNLWKTGTSWWPFRFRHDGVPPVNIHLRLGFPL